MERSIEIKKINLGILYEKYKRINRTRFLPNFASNFGLPGFRSTSEEDRELIYRPMAFDVTTAGLTQDLLYTTPTHYEMEGIAPKETPKYKDTKIKNFYNLSELLTRLGYSENITRDELEKLMRSITMDPEWLYQAALLFGFEKNKSGFFYPAYESDLSQEGFRLLRDVNDIGAYVPCIFEPEYRHIKKIK